MYLEERFTAKADTEGPFTASIEFDEKRRTAFGEKDCGAIDGKKDFRYHALRACYELGIVVGVNETENGFELGFERKEDYAALMAIVEPKLVKGAEFRQGKQEHYEKMANDWFDELTAQQR